MKSAPLIWRCRGVELRCGDTAHIMGVLNITPDSFSDGGRHFDPARAIKRGMQMAAEGARILDVGGESSRPGAEPVSAEEELRRVLPVIDALLRETNCLLSIDTTKPVVADAALAAGAHIVNDITALGNPDMAAVVQRYGAGLIAMHMQGNPRTMQVQPEYRDVVQEVAEYLRARVAVARAAGIDAARIAVDPGIGFGKTVQHNVSLLTHLDALVELGQPIAVGVSRKSFLGALTGRPVNDRLAPSLAALSFSVLRGAHIMRVHDVKESCEIARILAILRSGQVRLHDAF
ncbi:MAG: dihydropteroate synthase [Kiritimatiellae bacterium]|nr:dihydropteroate synthase [Kiritimatiellia bacterium]